MHYYSTTVKRKSLQIKIYGCVVLLSIYSISVGNFDEKPLVLLCGWAMPCSCA